MNNKYIIKVEHPLVRPGLTIETEASERYVPDVVGRLMEIVRDINRDGGSATKTAKESFPYITTIANVTYSIDKDGNMVTIDKATLQGDPE